MKWPEVKELHTRAAAELIAVAERVPAERWLVPRADGKWSPAEVLEHLTLAYEVILRELEGGGGMQIRTKWWQRILLRFTMVPKILRGEGFPSGARAPRETRPSSPALDQHAAIARFRDLGTLVEQKAAQSDRKKLTHAYFGSASICDSMLLCARHIDHHRAQLPR